MQLLAISFVVFVLAAVGLAIGAILGRAPARSGCAAVAHIEDGAIRCALCGGCDGDAKKRGTRA